MRAKAWIVPAIVLVFVGAGTWLALSLTKTALSARSVARAARVARVVPESLRIKVEVLNATDTRGLARRAMFALRDAGFDVVYFGNTAERADTSVVLDRSGHAEWAALAARALQGARVEQKPDSSHFLDLTILVGRSWSPPRQPFSP
ncbi:MAG: LytR C-terminal domain-containing protein [Gemmatimonadales bacterium]